MKIENILTKLLTETNAIKKDCCCIYYKSNDNKRVLLQQRSQTKKLWLICGINSRWTCIIWRAWLSISIRETKEEIGVNLEKESLEFIGATRSENIKGDIINRYFNEYYHVDVDVNNITLQEEEVQNIKWFNKEDIIEKNNYDGLTDKKGCWEYLLKYFEITSY